MMRQIIEDFKMSLIEDGKSHKITLIEDQIKYKYLFRVLFDKQEYLIVSLHLAENVLRKNAYGMTFIPASLK